MQLNECHPEYAEIAVVVGVVNVTAKLSQDSHTDRKKEVQRGSVDRRQASGNDKERDRKIRKASNHKSIKTHCQTE